MCPFCSVDHPHVILSTTRFYSIFDRAPVTEGHALVIPFRHVENLFYLTAVDWANLRLAIRQTIGRLDEIYHPDAYNIGLNQGEAAGQTITHFHVHIIPRRKGDIENPRGGVRNLMKPLQEVLPEE